MQLDLVVAYPNPVSTRLTALLNMGGTAQRATVTLRDVSGRMLQQFQQQLLNGYSNIEIDLSRFAKASYILAIELPT